jgi:hypothetical protein
MQFKAINWDIQIVATLALGSQPRQVLARVWAKGEARESHFMPSGVQKECEGMNPHTPKGAPTLGVGVPMDFQIFKGQLQCIKPNGLRSYLHLWKAIET